MRILTEYNEEIPQSSLVRTLLALEKKSGFTNSRKVPLLVIKLLMELENKKTQDIERLSEATRSEAT